MRDSGCEAIYNNAKYLSNLGIKNLLSNKELKKIECWITSESREVMYENIKYLKKLKEIL